MQLIISSELNGDHILFTKEVFVQEHEVYKVSCISISYFIFQLLSSI